MNLVALSKGGAVSFTVYTLCAELLLCLPGCGSHDLPTPVQLADFQKAGPVDPPVDLTSLALAKVPVGPYKVGPGDLLSIRIPALRENVEADATGSFPRRVDKDGNIWLPIVPQPLPVKGKTLLEVEEAVMTAYYTEKGGTETLLVRRPSVVVQVTEYQTVYVDITGGVPTPGRYQLRRDELSLVALLMKAGNVVAQGANVVRITYPGEKESRSVLLPIRGMNIPFTDVALAGGEQVEVDRLSPQTFTILGPIRSPGTYAYPPDAKLTLSAALGQAGGVDPIADPRFVTVYRQDGKGGVVTARLQLNGDSKWQAANLFSDNAVGTDAFLAIKPGDLILVEEDARTRTRAFLAKSMGFQIGGSATANTQATLYKDYSGSGGVRVRP